MTRICICGHPPVNHGSKNGCTVCAKISKEWTARCFAETDSVKAVFKRTPSGKLKVKTAKEKQKILREWVEEQGLLKRTENSITCPCKEFDMWYSGDVYFYNDGDVSINITTKQSEAMALLTEIMENKGVLQETQRCGSHIPRFKKGDE